MDAIRAKRQSFRMRGRSYVALTVCPVVPITGWTEEIDVTLVRAPGIFAGKPVAFEASCWPSTTTTRPRKK
jgi:septum site-determining protein MinC